MRYEYPSAGMPDNEQRYWRLPTEIAPILTYLLYSVTHDLVETKIEALRLAIELRALLEINCVNKDLLRDPDVGHGNPDVRGGNSDVGSKRGRDGGPGGSGTRKGDVNPRVRSKRGRDGGAGSSGARMWRRQTPPQREAHGSVQAGELHLQY